MGRSPDQADSAVESVTKLVSHAILRNTPAQGGMLIRSNLIALMHQRQFKAAELARAAGVNRSAVTALANNRARRVELATLERLCIVLDCQLADLLEIVPDGVSHAGPLAREGGI